MDISGSEPRGRGGWIPLILCGFFAGVVINVIEWIVHRVWLDAQWNSAFAALGKTPAFWAVFVVANFGVGIVGLWSYRWLSGIYGRGRSTALKIAAAMWIIFWFIPIAGLQPFDIFPNYLISMVVIAGIADVALGIVPAIWLFNRMREK